MPAWTRMLIAAGMTLLAFLVPMRTASAEDGSGATVESDSADYIPGDYVTLTGSGWGPGETVSLRFDEQPETHEAIVLYTVADDNGNIYDDNYLIQDDDVGVAFTLTATGLSSGQVAQTTFTDACGSYSLTPDSSTGTFVKTAVSTTFQVKVKLSRDNSGPVISVTSVRLDLPSGWSFAGGTSQIQNFSLARNTSTTVTWGVNAPSSQATGDATARFASGTPACDSFQIRLTTDSTKPVFSPAPQNLVREATSASGAVVTYSVSATDNVDGTLSPACSPASGSTFPLDTVTVVTCSTTDRANNTAVAKFDIDVVDTTPPSFNGVPSSVNLEATSTAGAIATFNPKAKDTVDGNLPVSCVPASGSTFPLGSTTVVCSSTDDSGNSATVTFPVNVSDTTPPVLSLPSVAATEATGPLTTVPFSVTASDIAWGDLTSSVVCNHDDQFSVGTTTVSCSVTDGSGNTTSGSFDVVVTDTTAPTVNPLANQSLEATGPGGAVATFVPSATDLVDGALAVTCTPASGSMFPLGNTSVSCSATDAHGNTGSSSFVVTVVDTTPPAISGITGDSIIEAGPGDESVFTYASPTANDLVDGNVAVSCVPASGSEFSLGTTTVVCTATDAHGNSSSASFTVTVQDTLPPVFSDVPALAAVEATGPTTPVFWSGPFAEDLAEGPVDVSCDFESGSSFPVGTTVVTCTTSDSKGNSDSTSFEVVVQDTTPPALSETQSIAGVEATSPAGAVVTYTNPTANDLVDGAVAVDCVPASGSTFPLGDTPVTCTASDAHGNTSSSAFTVGVVDTTPPEIGPTPTIPAVEAVGPNGAVVTYVNPTANDIVDGAIATVCTPASGSTFPLGFTTVTCSATDAHGNSSSTQFNVEVVDTTPPVLSAMPNISGIEATGPDGAVVSYTNPSAYDLVDGEILSVCVPASGSTFALGQTTVVCSATDAHGNSASISFIVSVVDTTAPDVSFPDGDITLEATGPTTEVAWTAPVATDIVDLDVSDTVNCTPVSGAWFAVGSTTVVCTAEDQSGNVGSASFTVTITDTTAPDISAHADVYATATSVNGAVVSYALPTATDLVDGAVPTTCAPVSGGQFALGATLVTCTATDAHGNTGSSSFVVYVTYCWSNFLQPINTNGSSIFKAGSTVPVKFKLTDASAPVTNAVASLFITKFSGGVSGSETEAVSTSAATTGNLFRYDATAGQYIFNLSTKGMTDGTYQLRVDLGDGVSHTVMISLKK